MLRLFIDSNSFWVIVVLCMGSLTLIALAAAYIAPRFFNLPNDKEHNERSNALIAILSGGFSVLLAFIIFNSWNALSRAQDNAAQEANALAVLLRDIAVFPEEAKSKLTHAISKYVVTVRVQEWETMRHGKENTDAALAINNLFSVLQSYSPVSSQEQIYYSQALLNLNAALKYRRDRMNSLISIIPDPVGNALIVGSLCLALALGLVRGRAEFINLIPIILFNMVLGFNLAIALNFDFPFSGDIAVSNRFFYHGVLANIQD